MTEENKFKAFKSQSDVLNKLAEQGCQLTRSLGKWCDEVYTTDPTKWCGPCLSRWAVKARPDRSTAESSSITCKTCDWEIRYLRIGQVARPSECPYCGLIPMTIRHTETA